MDSHNIRKVDCIIGIDPDCEKSGVAIFLPYNSQMLIGSYLFADLLDHIRSWTINHTIVCVVEAGWKNQSNWHLTNCNKRQAAAIGNAVGRNHETGRKIVEMLRHYGIEVIEQPPYVKTWRGRDRKITHAEIAELLNSNGIRYTFSRSNQEERDAMLLALLQANKPLTIKV